MPAIADMVRLLVDKGAAPDLIQIAIEGAERAVAETLRNSAAERDSNVTQRDTRRRKADAARQKRYRDNNVTLRENNVTQRDLCDAALVPQVKNLTSFKKDSYKIDSSESVERGVWGEVANMSPQTKRGTRLPSDWTPDDPDFGNEILGEQRAQSELDKFRDHWAAQPGSKGVKLDWQATWRNWVRKAPEFAPRNGAKPLTYFQQQREEMRNVLDRLGTSREATAELFPAHPSDEPEGLHRRDGSTVFELPRIRDRRGD